MTDALSSTRLRISAMTPQRRCASPNAWPARQPPTALPSALTAADAPPRRLCLRPCRAVATALLAASAAHAALGAPYSVALATAAAVAAPAATATAASRPATPSDTVTPPPSHHPGRPPPF